MSGGKKYCTVTRKMEKMLVILSEIWSYLTENFKWRNSGPYQIGHYKRLVILSVVIISGAYCSRVCTSHSVGLGLILLSSHIKESIFKISSLVSVQMTSMTLFWSRLGIKTVELAYVA